MRKHFQGESKVDTKNQDKTVKLVHNPKQTSRKWTRTRTPTQNAKLGVHDDEMLKNFVNH